MVSSFTDIPMPKSMKIKSDFGSLINQA